MMKQKLLLALICCFYGAATFAQKNDTLTTASGLKYFFLKKANGPALKPGWLAIWHYTLTLTDGTKVDASRDRGTPFAAQYPSKQVIAGATEALSLMHIGDRGIFIMPSSIAYGDKGKGRAIPPKATLVFDMELLDNKQRSLQMVLDSVLFGKPAVDTTKIHFKEAMATYNILKKKHFKDIWVTEDDLNFLGYALLKKYPNEALAFFKLNVKQYPNAWNVYDSLGDGYMAFKNKEMALKNYRISVTLNPKNTNGLEMINKLRGGEAPK